MKLTSRIIKMIHLLLDENNYVTVQFIADKTNISSRTVIRELSAIENWLSEKNIILEKKKGTGIRILLDQFDRGELRNSLMEEKSDLVYAPHQRLVLLKVELLKNFELTKLYTLTKLFDVTEGTISADLDKLEVWLTKYGLALTRKPGLGIYINGSERSVRSAIISVIYEQFHESDLINLIINKDKNVLTVGVLQDKMDQVILEFIDLSHIEMAKQLLTFVEEQMGYQIADHSFLALIIRISVTIKRCQQGIYIAEVEEDVTKVKNEKIYDLVKEYLTKESNIQLNAMPEEELFYLAVHIKGAKLRETRSNNKISMTEDYKTIKLAKEIIYVAEKETGIYLDDNEKLLIGLVRHLRPAIYRMKMKLDIINPLLEDIKQMYPQLFEATRKCAGVIESREGVVVPEDEMAYLATHIGAAIKSERRQKRKRFRVVVACTNGIGASQLMVTEIEKEFPEIEIVDIVSTINMDELKLQKMHIDLIITTVPMPNSGLPTIFVNTIMNQGDHKRIKEVLDNFLPDFTAHEKVQNLHFKDKLKNLKLYSDLILQVLENFTLVEAVDLLDVEGLIGFVSHAIAKTESNAKALENAFKDREEKGSTILGQKGMMLLHCRSKVVEELYLMVVRTQVPMRIKNSRGEFSKVVTVVVMVAPLNISSNALEVLSEVTRKTITSDFALTLKQSGKEEIYAGVSNILDQFIQNKVNTR